MKIEKEYTCKCCNKLFTSIKPLHHCFDINCINNWKTHWRKICQLGVSHKSGNDRKKGSGGLREGGGRTISRQYISPIAGNIRLNNDEIEVAKIFDELKINWKRNWVGFQYIDLENNNRKFYPDFYLTDLDLYVEYKGWVVEEMRHKMRDSLNRNSFNLLIVTNERFKEDGILLKDLKEQLLKYTSIV